MDFIRPLFRQKTQDIAQPLGNHIQKPRIEPLNEPTRASFLSGWTTDEILLTSINRRSPVTLSDALSIFRPKLVAAAILRSSSNRQDSPAQTAIK